MTFRKDGTDNNLCALDKIGEPDRPVVIVSGLKRSGKTSIRKVVFQKKLPSDTQSEESTGRITQDIVCSAFVNFEMVEFPGYLSHHLMFAASMADKFRRCGAFLFIIDAQDDIIEAQRRMAHDFAQAYIINSKIKFEVFIHKVEDQSEESKLHIKSEIAQKLKERLLEQGHEKIMDTISFYLTSIYDHSIFEALSKVVQKLIKQLSTLERLLEIFNKSSNAKQSFLFDPMFKIYFATNSSPVDTIETFKMCHNMLDFKINFSEILSQKVNCAAGFDDKSYAEFQLEKKQVLALWQITKDLAFFCILKSGENKGIIHHNFNVFKQGILKWLQFREETRLRCPCRCSLQACLKE